WFARIDENNRPPTKYDYRFITADTAMTTKSYSDFSVFQLWGVKGRMLYLIDMVRGKWEAPVLEDTLVKFVAKAREVHKNDGVLSKVIIDKKASGIGLIQSASRTMRTPIEPFVPDTDKLTRVMSALPQIKAGNVVLPDSAPWLPVMLSEFAAFTADDSHLHDDIVDATTMAINCELNLADDPVGRMKRLAGLAK